MAEHETRLEEYRKWVIAGAKQFSPQKRVSLFCYLLATHDFDDIDNEVIDKNYDFALNENDKFRFACMMRDRLFAFSRSKKGIIQPCDISDEEKDYIRVHKNEILYPMLRSSVDEMISSSIKGKEKAIRCKSDYLEKKWRLLKKLSVAKKKIKLRTKERHAMLNWFYVAIFLLISVLVGYIVSLGWVEKPSVIIEFNVGEIVGGILAGAGVLLAGGAYAAKTIRENGSNEQG